MRGLAAVVLALAVGGACGKGEDDRGPRAQRGGSKAGFARAMAKKLAHEAYPQYAMKPSNQGKCPSTDELGAFEDQPPGFRDPWGHPYQVTCGGPQGIRVSSNGPDGAEGTSDDLSSSDE